ncbi:threonine synthase [Streptomyces sp. WMMB 714]|uniref:threonine synthase n=1 Tax=Streptomyces sp. WMMB 714 TaxID=1286822 RepID=UPI0008237DA0|nr:threonine synthase [Streptomyces sp. WMMB 714]SCK11314.1 threonine synthase [Streptomyces sp. WMMB 714]
MESAASAAGASGASAASGPPARGAGTRQWRGVIEEYRDRLALGPDTAPVSLREGGTPLVPAQLLSELTGCDVHLKVEGANPTGSFKDRGMTMAITHAKEEGAQAVICASTGNTSASAAAYAVRAGMVCAVLVPQGKIALGKMGQALVHGAKILQVEGNFDDCLTLARGLSDKYPVALVNSVNPHRIEGQKTAAFEVVDMLGDAPDIHVLPVGNAGNITAYWRGYREYAADGPAARTPRMWGFQASGAAPIVRGEAVKDPSTIATAIRIGNPASWELAEQARDESGGFIDAVTDRQILRAYKLLAQREGVFVEPASAASVAGLLQAAEQGQLEPGQRVVCTVTGNGLKDPDWAVAGAPQPVIVPIDADAAAERLGLA